MRLGCVKCVAGEHSENNFRLVNKSKERIAYYIKAKGWYLEFMNPTGRKFDAFDECKDDVLGPMWFESEEDMENAMSPINGLAANFIKEMEL